MSQDTIRRCPATSFFFGPAVGSPTSVSATTRSTLTARSSCGTTVTAPHRHRPPPRRHTCPRLRAGRARRNDDRPRAPTPRPHPRPEAVDERNTAGRSMGNCGGTRRTSALPVGDGLFPQVTVSCIGICTPPSSPFPDLPPWRIAIRRDLDTNPGHPRSPARSLPPPRPTARPTSGEPADWSCRRARAVSRLYIGKCCSSSTPTPDLVLAELLAGRSGSCAAASSVGAACGRRRMGWGAPGGRPATGSSP
jgi:hypothetical protein